MSKYPLVSVIIPVYNSEKYVDEAIHSILNQTYQNIEIIVIDDGSTDESKKVVKRIQSSKIIYVENEQNIGVSATRNKGFELANGKYIALMDADDISVPNRLERQVEFLENNSKYGVVSSYYEQFTNYPFYTKKRIKKTPLDTEIIHVSLLFTNVVCGAASMIRTETLKKNNIKFDTSLQMAEDFDLWKRLSFVARIANLDEVLYKYRIHKNNSMKKMVILDRDFIKVIVRSFDHFNFDIRHLFNVDLKLKDINSFVALNEYLEKILKLNRQTREYHQKYLEESCAKLLHWMFKKHLDVFGYELYKELQKIPLHEAITLSSKERRKLFFKSLLSK